MRVSRATSADEIARTSSAGSMPESTASASFGPMPLTEISRSKSGELERRGEAEELQRVFADVRVDAQRHAPARLADGVERRQRHDDVVADAADVDDEPLHVFFEQRAGKMRDHGACRLVTSSSFTWRQLRR